MEDRRGEFIVIVAGYSDEMKIFINSNPGLESRFDKAFEFEDYNNDELFALAEKMLKEQGLYLNKDAKKQLKVILESKTILKNKTFANGRGVRKIVEDIIRNHHIRIYDTPKNKRIKDTHKKIILADVLGFNPTERK
ncbi:MAG TPA: hypothetical protein VHP32_04645 [Ignavibacteria bacterium]|nr:hypothetical protein [Ignavibacteria bacterium]